MNSLVKGTVSLISIDLPCKGANARFTTLLLESLSDKNVEYSDLKRV